MYHLARAAIEKGIQVSLFLDLDGVMHPIETQRSVEVLDVPKIRINDLLERGARVYVCGTCLNARGLFDPDALKDGIISGNMEDLAAIFGEVDRLVSL